MAMAMVRAAAHSNVSTWVGVMMYLAWNLGVSWSRGLGVAPQVIVGIRTVDGSIGRAANEEG